MLYKNFLFLNQASVRPQGDISRSTDTSDWEELLLRENYFPSWNKQTDLNGSREVMRNNAFRKRE